MASGPWTLFDTFRLWEADDTFDLDSDTDYKVCLLTATWNPDVTKSLYGDLTNELPTALGYTAGGAALTQTYVQNVAQVTLSASAVAWTAAGGTLSFRYAVIYKNSTSPTGRLKPLIAYCDLDSSLAPGANISLTAGASGTLTFPNGIMRKQ